MRNKRKLVYMKDVLDIINKYKVEEVEVSGLSKSLNNEVNKQIKVTLKDVESDINLLHSFVPNPDYTEWIPCKETLPPVSEKTTYIVTTVDGKVVTDIYYKPLFPDSNIPRFHKWNTEEHRCYVPDVIAWRCDLQPYKEN